MRSSLWIAAVLLVGAGSSVAHAQDFDDFIFDDEDRPPPPPKEEGDADDPLILPDDEDEEDFLAPEEEGPGLDLGDEDVRRDGEDSARDYRAQQSATRGMAADEEVMAWEAYLERFPNSIYREQIEARIDKLVESQFRMGLEGPAGEVDAAKRELIFVSPLNLPNVNPRTRLQVGLDFGVPIAARGGIDFELAFLRNLSAHVGLMGRYGGWGLELGPRWAFVKSARHDLVVTLNTDLRVNFGPLYFQARPQLGIGKIFGPVQIVANIGTEIETRRRATAAVIGGLHVAARLADPIGVWAEASSYGRNLTGEGDSFTFNVISFGIRLFPKMGNRTDDPLEIGAGAHVPYAQRYYQPYLGAAHVQGNYYFEPLW